MKAAIKVDMLWLPPDLFTSEASREMRDRILQPFQDLKPALVGERAYRLRNWHIAN